MRHESPVQSSALTFVLFGGTGSHACQEVLPALFMAYRHGRLTGRCRILCVAREAVERDAYLNRLKAEVLRGAAASQSFENDWLEFADLVTYLQLDICTSDAAARLSQHLNGAPGATIHYLATKPALFPATGALLRYMAYRRDVRVVVGSLSGGDAAASRAIDEVLEFDEDRIFRVDHYLGKQSVQDLLAFRFGSGSLDLVWNREWIRDVRITVAEAAHGEPSDEKTAGRAGMRSPLHLLSGIAMEAPCSLDPDAVRNERVSVLRAPGCPQRVPSSPSPAQKPYPMATRPTTGEITTEIRNARWRGVPFFLQSGTGVPDGRSEIVVNFRSSRAIPVAGAEDAFYASRMRIALRPDDGVCRIDPGSTDLTREVARGTIRLEMTSNIGHAVAGVDACERLLLDVVAGRLSSFVRQDERAIAAQWTASFPEARQIARDARKRYAVRNPFEQYGDGRNQDAANRPPDIASCVEADAARSGPGATGDIS